jgi:hypothetical protein
MLILSFTRSQAVAEDLAKQMSQNNIAVFLIECVAKYLACVLSIGSQLCHIAKGPDWLLGVTASSSPFDQIDNVDLCPSYGLCSLLA